MALVLALDQGTTSSRAIVFDDEARVRGAAQEEFPQTYPRPGWVEHDPEALWASQVRTAKRAIEAAGVRPGEIAAIGIANQRETTLLWERRTGRPVANALVWQDRRTAALCEQLRAEGLEPTVRAKTGLVCDPYFSATKLRWLLDSDPDLQRRAERGELAFGTVDSFLLWRLTGGRVHATDVSNASRTLLFSLESLDWDAELLEVFRIPRAVLPRVVPSSGPLGESDPRILGAATPVAGMAGDQQAAAFGQACHVPGMAKNTYGTGSFLLLNTGPRPAVPESGLLGTVGWQVDGRTDYAVEGSIFVTGAAIQWLRDGLAIVATAEESEALAASVPDSGGVHFVPAFVGLGAPWWNSSARGILSGLTRGTERGHIARAALEAACFQTRDVILAMEAGSGVRLRDLRVDGGMARNNLMLQIQADLLGIPVHRPRITETTALGAAFLAGLSAGVWRGMDEASSRWEVDRTFEPAMDPAEREERCAAWRAAVRRALS